MGVSGRATAAGCRGSRGSRGRGLDRSTATDGRVGPTCQRSQQRCDEAAGGGWRRGALNFELQVSTIGETGRAGMGSGFFVGVAEHVAPVVRLEGGSVPLDADLAPLNDVGHHHRLDVGAVVDRRKRLVTHAMLHDDTLSGSKTTAWEGPEGA
jgi:hypothetical protein